MNTPDGKWIISQDSPLLDQIAVEMPYVYQKEYMPLRNLIDEYIKNDGIEHKMMILKCSLENLLEKLEKVKKGEPNEIR